MGTLLRLETQLQASINTGKDTFLHGAFVKVLVGKVASNVLFLVASHLQRESEVLEVGEINQLTTQQADNMTFCPRRTIDCFIEDLSSTFMVKASVSEAQVCEGVRRRGGGRRQAFGG